MRSYSQHVLLVSAFGFGVLVGGCRVQRDNPEHCYFADGDETCAELDPSLPYCVAPACSDAPYGCVAESDQPEPECHSPCGGAATAEQDASCVEVADETETDTGTDTETGVDTETGTEQECEFNADCPPEAAYCFFGECRPCDETSDPDQACFTLTEGQAPLCRDGACVECSEDDIEACIDAQLTCDTETSTCVPCTAHDQCPGPAACDLALGECMPADQVWHVDGDGGQDFTTLADAMAALGGGSGTLIIHELDNDPGYIEGVTVAGDRALAVFGAPGERPLLYMTPLSLEIADGARVYARDLVLRGQSTVTVTDARVELDACQLGPSSGDALALTDAELVMRNSMVRSVLDPSYPPLRIAGVTSVDVVYSTFLGFGDIKVVSCPGATIVPGSTIRNSIVGNTGTTAALDCQAITYTNNAVEDAGGQPDNTSTGDMSFEWFADAAYADLHILNTAPVVLSSAAVWADGDPVVDFDGDPRPAVVGSQDFAGADRLP